MIPNGTDPKAHDWEYWNRIGMTIWASTDGSEEGRRGVSRMVGQVAEVRSGHDRNALAALLQVAADQARLRLAGLSGPRARAGMALREPGERRCTAAVGEMIAQMLRERDEPDDDKGSTGSSGSAGNAGGAAGAGAGGTASTPPLIEARPFVLRDPKTLPSRHGSTAGT